MTDGTGVTEDRSYRCNGYNDLTQIATGETDLTDLTGETDENDASDAVIDVWIGRM